MGCKNCILCKKFLVETDNFKSYECPQTYQIKDSITCTDEGVIYLIRDLICKKSYIGSTMHSMRVRWANYKNHIKSGYSGCELATHFKETETKHPLKFGSGKGRIDEIYNSCLIEQLDVTIIEKVNMSGCSNKAEKRRALERAEGKWQTELRTMTRYGGQNKKDDRKITNRKASNYHSSSVAP